MSCIYCAGSASKLLLRSSIPQGFYELLADSTRHDDVVVAMKGPNRNTSQFKTCKKPSIHLCKLHIKLILAASHHTSTISSTLFRPVFQPCSDLAGGAPDAATGTAAAKPQKCSVADEVAQLMETTILKTSRQ